MLQAELVHAVEDARNAEAAPPPQQAVFLDRKNGRCERHAAIGRRDPQTEPFTLPPLSVKLRDERVPFGVQVGGGQDLPDEVR